MKICVFVVLIAFGITTNSKSVWGRPEQTEFDEADYNNDETSDVDDFPEGETSILSSGQNFTVSLGSTVELPCKIKNIEVAVPQWSKNNDQLFFKDTVLTDEKRYSTNADFTLKIENAQKSDSASYSCVLLGENSAVVHYLNVISSPRITRIHPEREMVEGGTPISFMCEASGTPTPKISWKKETMGAPDTEEIKDPTITYDKLDWSHTGNYTCVAINENGKDEKTVSIKVLAPPSIYAQSQVVTTAEGYESEISCIVYSHDWPNVVWRSADSRKIKLDNRVSTVADYKTRKHTLRIGATKKTDFGKYICEATNSQGDARTSIELTGLPLAPIFYSTEMSPRTRNPILTWKTESVSKIDTYEIQYKRQQDDEWVAIPFNENDLSSQSNNNIQSVSYEFQDLSADTYEAKIRAKNIYGWSAFSEVQYFPGGMYKDSSMHDAYGYLDTNPENDHMQSGLLESTEHNSASLLDLRIFSLCAIMCNLFYLR